MILPPKRPRAVRWAVAGSNSRSSPGNSLWIALFLTLIVPHAWAQQTSSVEDDGDLEITEGQEASAPATPSALTQFTTAIENREPVDQITFVENDVRKIFFFSDLRSLTGSTVFHRWIYDGEVQANVEFKVKGPRWRVWSSKELEPERVGDWTVEVLTDDGETIASETFTYTASNE
jgi:hypothetical protein